MADGVLRDAPASDVVEALRELRPVVWSNPRLSPWKRARADVPLTDDAVDEARTRLERHAGTLARAFPGYTGIVSPLRSVSASDGAPPLLAKLDNELPVAGSIKARGGFHEVLSHAESLVGPSDDLTAHRDDLARYRIAVGSTGNLGLSIGLLSRALGFSAEIHMSSDARRWKKDLLRSVGASVIEYDTDYSEAVARGRAAAAADPLCHFVDDENSRALFLGYAAAGQEVADQLRERAISPSSDTPLTVYLPCGVGGGPGGVCFGLKLIYGDAVRCVFVEPTHAPAMLLGLATGHHDRISGADIGLDTRTIADGLAVGRPSRFVGRALARAIDAVVTVTDAEMVALVGAAWDRWSLRLEPSAAAAPAGLLRYRETSDAPGGYDLVWLTGGGLMPEAVFREYLRTARETEPPDILRGRF